MKTNKTSLEIDGESFNFYFEKSGGDKGAGLTGEKDDKFYQSGKLLEADSDDKYSVIRAQEVYTTNGVINSELDLVSEDPGRKDDNGNAAKTTTVYDKLEDAEELLDVIGRDGYWDKSDLEGFAASGVDVDAILDDANINKDLDDLDEVYIFIGKNAEGEDVASPLSVDDYFVVNTSGSVSDSRGRHKDGNDFVYSVVGNGNIAAVYVED